MTHPDKEPKMSTEFTTGTNDVITIDTSIFKENAAYLSIESLGIGTHLTRAEIDRLHADLLAALPEENDTK